MIISSPSGKFSIAESCKDNLKLFYEGSTAYALAAGASMIHPSVPAIMVTPICPHSLSFRPIVVPAGVELKISVSPDSRNTSWVSFDGRRRQELLHGDR